MNTVRFRVEAIADIQEIAEYISESDPSAADRVVQRIYHVAHNVIGLLPLAERFAVETGAREFPVPGLPYVIVYLAEPELVEIVAVFHTARDPAAKR